MYVKYVTSTANHSLTMTDIQSIIEGTATSVDDLLYADYGTQMIGTGPSVGTYHTFTTVPTSTTIHYFSFIKNHANYDAITFPAQVNMRIGYQLAHSLGFGIANKSGANVGNYTNGYIGGAGSTPLMNIAGGEIHFIINDTSLVMQGVQAPGVNPDVVGIGLWMFSDFAKIDFDEYCIQAQSNYYAGAMMVAANFGGYTNDYQVNVTAASHCFGCYRFNYPTPNGSFQNTGTQPSSSAGGDWYNRSTVYVSTNSIGFGTLPFGNQRIVNIPSSTIKVPPLQPLYFNGYGNNTYDQSANASSGGQMLYDTRGISHFSNCYRTGEGSKIGDIIQEGDGTNYRVFRGQKVGSLTQTTAYQTACYAFPENNVLV